MSDFWLSEVNLGNAKHLKKDRRVVLKYGGTFG